MEKLVGILIQKIILFVLLLLFIAILSCKTPKPLSFTKTDADDTITLPQNEYFNIQLNSNPGSGLQWKLAQAIDTTIVQLDSIGFIPAKNLATSVTKTEIETTIAAPTIGNNESLEVFYFHTIDKGNTSISFHQARPWEKETAKHHNLQSFELKVR